MVKLTIGYLSKEELTYEVTVRDVDVPGAVMELRSRLSKLLLAEKTNPNIISEYPLYPYTDDEDVKAIDQGMTELGAVLDDFSGKESRKVESKLWHLMGRVKRMDVTSASRGDLLKGLIALRERYDLAVSALTLPSELSVLERSIDESLNSDQVSVTGNSPLEVAQSGVGPLCKVVPVHKWDVKFSGEPGVSVSSFLERVDELSVARGVSKAQVFVSALDLFEGPALSWYRSIRRTVKTWGELEARLRGDFQPDDYDEQLLEELRRRSQGREESVTIYFACMMGLFSRLTTAVSEDIQIKILRRNILPVYQSQLTLQDVVSVGQLKELCKRLEEAERQTRNFLPPTCNSHTLEPDLAYVNDTRLAGAPARTSSDRSPRGCYNCGKTGHLMKDCRLPRTRRCYGCGLLGVTRSTCSRCATSNRASSSGNAEGRY